MGEIGIQLSGAYIVSQPFTLNVVSTRTSTNARGTIQIKLGFVTAADAVAPRDFRDIYSDLVKLSRPSLVSAPPVSHPGALQA